MGSSLVGPRALLAFLTHHRVLQAVGCGSALLSIGYTAVQVQLGNYAGVVHLAYSLRFRLRKLCCCFGLAVVGARFFESILGRLPILLKSLFFRSDLFFAGMDLRIRACHLGLLFGELKLLSPRVEFHQDVPSLYFLLEYEVGFHDSAADYGFNWMGRAIHFQVGLIRDRVDRYSR